MCLHGVRLSGAEQDLFAGRTRARYIADRFIFGAAVGSEEDLRLTHVYASFRGLREWLMGWTRDTESPLPAADVHGGQDSKEDWVRTLSIRNGSVEVQLVVARTSSTSRFRTVYDTTASVQFVHPEGLTLAEWRRQWIEPMRDLVLFGTREQTVTLALSGRFMPDDALDLIRVYADPEVAIQTPRHSPYYQRDLLPAGIWGQDGLRDLISGWQRLHCELDAVAQALFELSNTSDLAPLTRLLRLTSCAEGYHRARHDAPPFSDEQHDDLVSAMLEALPEDRAVRAHYKSRLEHANSQSQRRRIRWLIERTATVDDRLAGQAAQLTNRLVDWRNDHTHLESDVATPPLEQLVLLNAVLTYVLEANILMDLGIGEDTKYCLAHGYVWDDPIPTFLVA